MADPFRRNLFQITDEEPLETHPLEDTASPAGEPVHDTGLADEDITVGSRHAAEDPAKGNAPPRRSLPGSKAAYAGVIAALATGIIGAVYLLRDSGTPQDPAGDRAHTRSSAARINRAQPAPSRTARERAPRRGQGRTSRRVGHAEPRRLPEVEAVAPATVVPRTVPPPVSPPLSVRPGPPVARRLGQEFGFER